MWDGSASSTGGRDCCVCMLWASTLLSDQLWSLAFFFFFQAEDGIRDGRVTGVQTCALPIYGDAEHVGLLGTDGFQEADVLGITMPAVKHSFMIQHPMEIPRALHEAFYLARTGRPGQIGRASCRERV